MNATARDRRIAARVTWLRWLKAWFGPCRDCGADHHLTWDHVRGVKEFTLGNVGQIWKRSWHDLLVEVQKCDVVCLWCHDRREQERGRLGPLNVRVML